MTAFPTLWLGPAGSGKITAARAAAGCSPTTEPRLQTLEIGDYSARFWEAPTHMEIDIGDLSMMDKQILPEMLHQLLSSRDVARGGGRKIMILRRVHGLSPAAAQRLRVCLEELVWDSDATAIIWMTARVANAVVLSLMDGFVLRRCEASTDDADEKLTAATLSVVPATVVKAMKPSKPIQNYIAEMLRQMVFALQSGPPSLKVVPWIRARVYDLLGLMVNGADLVAGLVWATLRLAAAGSITDSAARRVLATLARARWIPSYRTPLVYELIISEVYAAVAKDQESQISATK